MELKKWATSPTEPLPLQWRYFTAIWARRELREKHVLLDTRKTRKTGKKVAFKGRYLLTKEDILKVVQDLEEGTKKKKIKKGGKKTNYILISSEKKEEESADELA